MKNKMLETSREMPRLENQEADPTKEKLVALLEDRNVLLHINGNIIVDTRKLCDPDFFRSIKDIHLSRKKGDKINASKQIIFEKLADMEVVSAEDFEQNLRAGEPAEPKPLFNIPESIDEAFDSENIRNKKYYLNIWDVGSKMRWENEIEAKNGEKINSKELFFAVKMFREGGVRRENGKLVAFDSEKGMDVPASVEWIRNNISSNVNYEIGDSVHEFLVDNCQNVLNKGLINMDDFQIKTTDKSGKILRKEFGVGEKTEVMINGVRYYIGRDKFIFNGDSVPKENITVTILDQKTAGIIVEKNGKKKIEYVFELLGERDKEMKRHGIEAGSEKNLPKNK